PTRPRPLHWAIRAHDPEKWVPVLGQDHAPGISFPMDPRRPALSFVLPAHNERQNVAAMAAALPTGAAPLGAPEIRFVDDGSTDDTLAEIKTLTERHEAVRYVSFTRNFGHQAALRAGLHHARGEAVVLMDCDFEHPPEVVPLLVEQWRQGAKVVVTQRM